MKANLFLSQDSRDLPLMCFVLLVVAAKISISRVCLGTVSSKIVSAAYKRSLSKGRVDIVFLLILLFGGCVSLLFYHLFFYRHRYLWVISIIIICLTIKKLWMVEWNLHVYRNANKRVGKEICWSLFKSLPVIKTSDIRWGGNEVVIIAKKKFSQCLQINRLSTARYS